MLVVVVVVWLSLLSGLTMSLSPTQGLLNREWDSQLLSGHFIRDNTVAAYSQSCFVLVQLVVTSGPVHHTEITSTEIRPRSSKLFEQFSVRNGAYKLFLDSEQITNISNHSQSASVKQS